MGFKQAARLQHAVDVVLRQHGKGITAQLQRNGLAHHEDTARRTRQDLHDPCLHQQLDGFSQRGATHAQLLRQALLGGQPLTHLHIARAYRLGDTISDDLTRAHQLHWLKNETGWFDAGHSGSSGANRSASHAEHIEQPLAGTVSGQRRRHG